MHEYVEQIPPKGIPDAKLIQAVDYDGSGNILYQGEAEIGTAKSTAKWRIRKLSYDGLGNLTDVQYSGGRDAFEFVWNDRASLTYS